MRPKILLQTSGEFANSKSSAFLLHTSLEMMALACDVGEFDISGVNCIKNHNIIRNYYKSFIHSVTVIGLKVS